MTTLEPNNNRSDGVLQSPELGVFDSGKGTGRTPLWLWVVIGVLLVAVVAMQRPGKPDAARLEQEAKGLNTVEAPQGGGLVLAGKLILGVDRLFGMAAASGGAGGAGGSVGGGVGAAGTAQDPRMQLVGLSDQLAGWVGENRLAPPSAANPPKAGERSLPADERIRATMLAAEVAKDAELEWRLKDVEQTLDAKSDLVADVQALRAFWGVPIEAKAELTQAQRDGLVKRHGWFAELALNKGDAQNAVRTKAAEGGLALLIGMIVLIGLLCLALLAGFVLLCVGLGMSLTKRTWWRGQKVEAMLEWPAGEAQDAAMRPLQPKHVWLETVAVFLAGFLLLKLGILGLEAMKVSPDVLTWAAMLGQWTLLATIFWPLVRGMGFARWKSESGWATPRGLGKEIGAGVFGYLAGLPVYFGMAMIVVLVYMALSAITGGDGAPPSNRIVDMLDHGTTAQLIALYLLATIWAPVVEETMFRGALYRHLRRRWAPWVVAIITAAVFASLHGYMPLQLVMVGTLGVWFIVLREWRGSLVPCVTAHMLHNGVVLGVLLGVSSAMSV